MQGINFMYQYAWICTKRHANSTYQHAFSLSTIQSLWMSPQLMVTLKIRGIVFIHPLETKID